MPQKEDSDSSKQQTLNPREEQQKLLNEAKRQVETEAYHMIKALDKDILEEALKHSAKMLNELRTSSLTPKNYYELYMLVFDKLRHLEMYFRDEQAKGRKMEELYEVVQHAGNIVPRLYLLITVGSVYIKSREAPAKVILKDLVEMCKGVQHPTRGLFLRNYLSQMSKDKLPDKGSAYEGEGGTVKDAIDFILQNFKETVNLFSRLKNTGPTKEREKREKERLELRILVGTNLVRLSQLDGVEQEMYKNTVLPRVLDVITKCGDAMAQQYLMECIIQVFPDDFHIDTLDTFLAACLELDTSVDIKAIITSLMDRLAQYAKQFPSSIPEELNIVEIFSKYIQQIFKKGLSTSDMLSIQVSLMSLCLQMYPNQIEYVNQILGYCSKILNNSSEQLDDATVKLVKKLLSVPIDAFKNILTILELDKYADILPVLDLIERKSISVEIVRSALKFRHPITTWDQVNKLFELIKPLIKDDDTESANSKENNNAILSDEEDFEEEQNLVARLMHLFHNDDTDVLFKVFSTARKHFGQGGVKRIQYTLAPLVFCYLRLAQRIQQNINSGVEVAIKEEKVFQYIMEILEVLANQKPSTALLLYLQSAQCADKCGNDKMVYEFMSQAFMLYEEEDSKSQLHYLTLIANTLQTLQTMQDTNFETLSTKTCQYTSKLLRKPDQCRAAFLCSHLFWPMEINPSNQNSSKALECMQWSLKIVKACMANQQIPLFVEILNVYMYHFDKNNDKVTAEYLNGLIDIIITNINNNEEGNEEEKEVVSVPPISIFYRNTISYLQRKKGENPTKYADVKV